MTRKLIAILVFAWMAGCAFGQAPAQQTPPSQTQEQQHPMTPPPSPAAEAAVYETVARYQITTWQLGGHVFCFRVKGRDADRSFLSKLKPYTAVPASDCTLRNNKDFTTTVVEKHSKKSAVMFGLGQIFWTSPIEAAVQGSYMCGTQCMAGGLYHVVLDGNAWKVTKFEQRIMQ